MPRPTRSKARILAFQIVYNRDKIGINQQGEDLLFRNSNLSKPYETFSQNLVNTTWQKLDEIDSAIKKHLINWKQTRISDTLNALLRVATCELLFFPETDSKVVFNEAIEICRNYVDEKATKLCNGTLHSIWQDMEKNSDLQENPSE